MGDRALAIVALVVVVGLTHPAAVASASQECVPTATATESAPVTASVEMTTTPGGRPAVTATYDTAATSDLSVSLDGDVQVVDAEGFDGGSTHRWDGETASPSLVYAADPTAELGYESGDGWVLTAVPEHDGESVEVVPEPTGVVGSEMLLVGEHAVHERSVGCQTIRLVVPEGVATPAEPDRILDALETATRDFDVGHRYGTVRVFVVPEATRPVYRTGRASGPDVWVRADRPLDVVDNTWIHEYVHTRQGFSLGDRMAWFREASAMYYAARISADAGLLSGEAYRNGIDAWTRDSTSQQTLAEASSLDNVAYYKGGAVLAALHRKIRAATDGRRTLADVFARMNAHDGPITYGLFKSFVVEVAGERFDAWLDRYVLTDAVPPAPGEESSRVGEPTSVEQVGVRPTVSVPLIARG
jgi:hypothetical protein